MSVFAATLENAERVIEIYSTDARRNGARPMSYGQLASALGLHPNHARNLGPLLDRVRENCVARDLPDVSAVIVVRGTDMPSKRSFNGPSGTWRGTGLTREGVKQLQQLVFAHDW